MTAQLQIRGGLLLAPSIDFFLESRSNYPLVVDIGKIGIAKHILDAERASTLSMAADHDFDSTQVALKTCSHTWAAALARGLIGNKRQEESSKVFEGASFIVFNYDRCLEQYLYYIIKHSFSMSAPAAAATMASVPIIHPYGMPAQAAKLLGRSGHAARKYMLAAGLVQVDYVNKVTIWLRSDVESLAAA